MPRLTKAGMKTKVEEKIKNSLTELQALNMPCLLVYLSNHGMVSLGTPSLVKKFKDDCQTESWRAAICKDQDILNLSANQVI